MPQQILINGGTHGLFRTKINENFTEIYSKAANVEAVTGIIKGNGDGTYTAVTDIESQADNTEALAIRTKDQSTNQSGYTKTITGYGMLSLPNNARSQITDVKIQGRSLKQELAYDRNTWAEWVKSAGATGDSTGLTFTTTGTQIDATLNTSLKPSTSYGVLANVVSNTTDKNANIMNYLTGSYPTIVPLGAVGNQKIIITTQAVISDNRFRIYQAPTTGSMKIRDIRVFELPAGSEIATDFNTLTADQLAQKYPYIKGGSIVSTLSGRLKSVENNLINPSNVIADSGVTLTFDKNTQIYTTSTTGLNKCIVTRRYVIPGTQYTIKRIQTKTAGGTSIYGSITIKDINGNILINANGNTSFTFTSTVNQIDIIVQISGGIGDLTTGTIAQFMMNIGATALPYAPYTETVAYTPADIILRSLLNGVKDEDNVTEGKVTKNNNLVIFNGSESWSYSASFSSTNTIGCTLPILSDMKASAWENIICNILTPLNSSTISNDVEGITVGVSSIVLRISKSKLSGFSEAWTDTQKRDAVKTWLSANLVSVIYQLLTPIVTHADGYGKLIAYANGTVFAEPCIWGFMRGLATKVITTTARPIVAIKKVIRFDISDTGDLVKTDVTADCTVGDSNTSITIANVDLNKLYLFDCDAPSELQTQGTMVLTVEVDNGVISHDYGASAADWVLTSNESKATMLLCTNAGGAAKIIAQPIDGKMYIINNTSGQTLTIKTASSTGVTVATAKTATVYFIGTDYIKTGEV